MNPTMQTNQARPPGETTWYAPARDLTVYFPTAVRAALEKWDDEECPYRHWLNTVRTGDNNEEVCAVAAGLAAMCSEDCIVEPKTYREALEKSGILRVSRTTYLAVMAAVGEEVMAAFWVGIRGATVSDADGKFAIMQYDPDAVKAEAELLVKYIRMPAWKRSLWSRWDRFRQRLIKLLGRG